MTAPLDDGIRTTRAKFTPPRITGGLSVATLLIVLSLIPLAGAAWFAGLKLTEVSTSRRQAQTVNGSTAELLLLTGLRAEILEERNWASITRGLPQVGVSNDIVKTLTGIDPIEEETLATQRVDSFVDELGLRFIASDINTIRSNPTTDLSAVDESYTQIELRLSEQSDAILDELLLLAGELQGGGQLATSLNILDASVTAQKAFAAELTNYFSGEFSGLETSEEDVAEILSAQALRSDALATIERISGSDLETTAALRALRTSPDVKTFETEAANLVTEAFDSFVPEVGTEGNDLLADLNQLAQTFLAGAQAADTHLLLVNASANDVAEANQQIFDRAETDNERARFIIALLAIASLFFTLSISRIIGKPLRNLAAAAQHLRDGDTRHRATVQGPTEVREAATAINEAAAHLELAERQATALAEGALAHDSLKEAAPGTLGSSLQNAVHTLAESLAERESFRKQLAHEATHDGLTHIPNRNAALDHLRKSVARTRRTDGIIAVMFLDLDGFKAINDEHGHQAGDSVLHVVAHRLLGALREGDSVGRLGGDEFLVIAEPIAGPEDAVALAERLLEAVSAPIHYENLQLVVTPSIGIALTSDADLTADELLYDADVAVYKAKAAGRGCIELCDEELKAALAYQADMEVALQRAIATDELTMFYQPIMSQDGAVRGAEALLRWHRPGHGQISPGEFIPLAERSELIIELDNWVLRKVGRQLAEWADDDILQALPVSINISARHLASDHFVPTVLAVVDEFKLDPERMIIEVTESSLLADPNDAAEKLAELRAAGVRSAIDDFGTGYTSLAQLMMLPIDIVKIDRRFTADSDVAALVELIIETGHLLGATITAEGIETVEQADRMRELGSDELQGFLFGYPSEPAAFVEFARDAAQTAR